MSPLGNQTFSATVLNTYEKRVLWSVQEGNEGGTINSSGVYKAPLTRNTYHVVATSAADTSRSGTAAVIVANQLTLTPDTATVGIGGSVQFTVAESVACTWQVVERNAGTITAGGKYTAPLTKGVYHIYVKSVDDPSKAAVATVTVQSGGASGGIE